MQRFDPQSGAANRAHGLFASAAASLRRLLAPRCAVCELAAAARCPVCALRVAVAGSRCGQCLRAGPHYDATVALADYAPPVDRMIAALKFNGRLPLADVFGRLLARAAAPLLRDIDALCAVPLAFERQAGRGFNQAHEIARRIARDSRRPLRPELLLRIRNTAAQMELPQDARRRNVRGAFAARGDLAGLRVAVVDDVMTTGATLDEVAAALKRAGASAVLNLVVARTP